MTEIRRSIPYRLVRWALLRALDGIDWVVTRPSRLIGGPE